MPCDDPEWSNFTKYFAQNFVKLGLKKLICTSYAPESKQSKTNYQVSLFEESAPQYYSKKTIKNGKIFTLDHGKCCVGKILVDDFDWEYLQGNGNFKIPEVKNSPR